MGRAGSQQMSNATKVKCAHKVESGLGSKIRGKGDGAEFGDPPNPKVMTLSTDRPICLLKGQAWNFYLGKKQISVNYLVDTVLSLKLFAKDYIVLLSYFEVECK